MPGKSEINPNYCPACKNYLVFHNKPKSRESRILMAENGNIVCECGFLISDRGDVKERTRERKVAAAMGLSAMHNRETAKSNTEYTLDI